MERKPDESQVIHGIGSYNTYELTENEMIELIAVIGKASKDPNTGETLEHRTFTQLLVQELGTVENLDNLAVVITVGRKRTK